MITALIFAGGTGQRMNSLTKPKQFLQLYGKEILIHTIENFEYYKKIDNIAVVCLAEYIDYLKYILKKNYITKVKWIVKGGANTQESVYNGLKAIYKDSKNPKEDIVLIHDGVRPIISEKLLEDNILSVKKYGSAISVCNARETIVSTIDDNKINNILERDNAKIAKAPQSFYLKDIMSVHNKAIEDNVCGMIDSASLMNYYGYKLHTVQCDADNIKITTPLDFYIFRAIYEARENSQILGL